jgi:UDPglucose--hexose-1-phosphate uridylyltransferase
VQLMRKTHMRLSDGRELIYFDESDAETRNVSDPRPPAPTPVSGGLRYDATLDEWVAMAGHRQDRTYLPPDDQCPLCPSAEGRHTNGPHAAAGPRVGPGQAGSGRLVSARIQPR